MMHQECERLRADPVRLVALPLMATPVAAGFPSPAEEFVETKLNLHDLVVPNPASTYLLRVRGTSMINAGIAPGDVLVVDRLLPPLPHAIIVASVDNEFTVKRLEYLSGKIALVAENESYAPILLHSEQELRCWGVVTYCIHRVHASKREIPCLRS